MVHLIVLAGALTFVADSAEAFAFDVVQLSIVAVIFQNHCDLKSFQNCLSIQTMESESMPAYNSHLVHFR